MTVKSQLEKVDKTTAQQLVSSLKELYDLDKPTTDTEIAQRIDNFFDFCQRSSIQPGIGSLCCALHISRTTLFNWSSGNGCSEGCKELICSARSFIEAYVEQVILSGEISSQSGIFLVKNWIGCEDDMSQEENISDKESKRILGFDELPILSRDGEKITESEVDK